MMTIITGGASSGKSHFAEALCMEQKLPRIYIATMKPFGEAAAEKIMRHRLMRKNKGFVTIERYTALSGLSLANELVNHDFLHGCILLECMSNLVANEMFQEDGRIVNPTEAVLKGIEHLRSQCSRLILVTNEVGNDGISYSEETLAYIEAIGAINRHLADCADEVYEIVCGIPITLKGEKHYEGIF